jgi:L-lactate dehydrogenase complex protein LldE
MPEQKAARPRVALFATCLVDLMRPSVGFAAAKLLEDANCEVAVPEQTCCGQPAYNSGARTIAKTIAAGMVETFAEHPYVVVPSASCAGMIRLHYPRLFQDDPVLGGKARALAARTFELTEFLVDVMKVPGLFATYDGRVAYHDSCSALRELGLRAQPRKLLAGVKGLTLCELDQGDACCGFGGTFCVKYSDVSAAITARKTAAITASRASLLLSSDLGCLLAIVGFMKRQRTAPGPEVKARHVAEVLAGRLDRPAIGEGA